MYNLSGRRQACAGLISSMAAEMIALTAHDIPPETVQMLGDSDLDTDELARKRGRSSLTSQSESFTSTFYQLRCEQTFQLCTSSHDYLFIPSPCHTLRRPDVRTFTSGVRCVGNTHIRPKPAQYGTERDGKHSAPRTESNGCAACETRTRLSRDRSSLA